MSLAKDLLPEFMVVNSNILVCLLGFGFGLCAPSGAVVVVGAKYMGSAVSSPGNFSLALHKRFLRFLGRLYPHTSLRLCKLSVV